MLTHIVRAGHIGHLITVKGIVIRVTEVQPYVTLCTYTCPKCHNEIFQRVNTASFTPLDSCISKHCSENKPAGKLEMQTRGCKFSKYQEVRHTVTSRRGIHEGKVKIQELAQHVPVGHVPRAISIHVHGELTRRVSPGDIATVHGVFLPIANTGFHAMKVGGVQRLVLNVLAIGWVNCRDLRACPRT